MDHPWTTTDDEPTDCPLADIVDSWNINRGQRRALETIGESAKTAIGLPNEVEPSLGPNTYTGRVRTALLMCWRNSTRAFTVFLRLATSSHFIA